MSTIYIYKWNKIMYNYKAYMKIVTLQYYMFGISCITCRKSN